MRQHHSDIEYVIPEWNNPQVQGELLKQLAAYSKAMGFRDEEMNNLRDRRLLLLAYKAMMFDRSVRDAVNKTKGK